MSKYENLEVDRLAAMFKALSNPNRLRLFLSLADCSEQSQPVDNDDSRCVGDLGTCCELAASTVSHHLKELNQAGLIAMQRSGQRVHCRANRDAMTALRGFLGDVLERDGTTPEAIRTAS